MVTNSDDSNVTFLLFDGNAITYGSAYGERSFNNEPVHVEQNAEFLLGAIRDAYFRDFDKAAPRPVTISYQSLLPEPLRLNYTEGIPLNLFNGIAHARLVDFARRRLFRSWSKDLASPLTDGQIVLNVGEGGGEAWKTEVAGAESDVLRWAPLLTPIKRSE